MAKISKKILTVLIVFFAIAVISFTKFVIFQGKDKPSKVVYTRAKGNPEAEIRIIEYVDFQCTACARGALFLKNFLQEHPDKIYLEVKYFPLKSHPESLSITHYVECAAIQGQFWPYYERLLDYDPHGKKQEDVELMLKEIARGIELNLQEFDACLNDETVITSIKEEKAEAKLLGINSTPTYIINDKMIVGKKSLKKELAVYFGSEEH